MTSEPRTLSETNNVCTEGRGVSRTSSSARLATSLERCQQEVPQFMEDALTDFGLMAAFRSRPSHQQDGYVCWIAGAERLETRDARVADMLDDLACVKA
jgi:Bacteriocin-protection, YdeI or OmpD-Associated